MHPRETPKLVQSRSKAQPGLDPALCPQCGQANGCAMETERSTGQAQAPCWCVGATFGADLLQRVPAAARSRACVCQRCAAV